MYKIYFIELNEVIDESVFSKLSTFVSAEKQQHVKDMRFLIDQKLTIYSEVLVRALTCRLYEVKNDELSFTQNAQGKPLLAGFSQFHFNISHTRNAMVVAIAEKAVGIDIERIKEVDLNIARRFFTEQEQAYISNEADKEIERQRRFYEIGTQKEVYIKHIGKGLSLPLKSFDVTESGIQDRTYCIEKGGYIISICGKDPISRKNIEIMQLSELDLLELAFLALNGFLKLSKWLTRKICTWNISIERVASGIHISHLYHHEVNGCDLDNIITLKGLFVNPVVWKKQSEGVMEE